MRLAWPSKARVEDVRDEEEIRFDRGEARPDFICIGAQKAGTTWLYRQLYSHPDFWVPPIKELEYFTKFSRTKAAPRPRDDCDVYFLEKIKKLSAQQYIDMHGYGELFESKGKFLSGDISPTYSMLNDEIVQQIIEYFPTVKVIFLARDPVERAWSQLSMGVRLGRIAPFDETDSEEVIRNLMNPGVFALSFPSKVVARWRRYVAPYFFRIYFFDDLEKNPTELRGSILEFLGSDPGKDGGQVKPDSNADANTKLRLSEKVRSRVAQFFKKELKACAEEFGGPARQWPARYGFSLLWFVIDILDDVDLLGWCGWLG